MKKRILSLLLAVITIIQIMPWSVLTVIAEGGEDETTGIDIADMEVGKLYKAIFKSKEQSGWWDVILYNDEMYEYKSSVMKSTLPQDLTVKKVEDDDIVVYITNEVWASTEHGDLDDYRYIDAYEVIILACIEEPSDGLVYGQVGLVMDGKTVTSLSIAEGEKTYVFTELSDKLDGDPTYRWELLIDRESNRWATVQDYVYPYAPISAALIANAGQEDGTATLRCIATQDGVGYASGELDISVDPSLPAPDLPLIPTVQSASMTPLGADNAGSTRAAEAFQVNIQYVYWNNSPLPEAGHGKTAMPTYMATVGGVHPPLTTTVTSLPIPGYTPYIRIPARELPADYKDHPDIYREYKAREIPDDPNSAEETHYYKKTLSIDFDHQETDYEQIVYYLPDLVTFDVNHYIQNLEDDGYTLYHTDADLPGYSDNIVGKDLQLKDLYGFTNLYYDPNTRISASSSTTLDIYYDREYYLVDFDLTGPNDSEGYGVMPLYVRYEAPVQVGDPQNPGYTFNGWNLVNVYTDTDDPKGTEVNDQNTRNQYINPSNAMTIKHNLKYTTNWTAATTTYTVIYWLENADDDNFTLHSFEVFNATPGDTVSASDSLDMEGEEAYFTYLPDISDKNVLVKGDGTTAVNVYYLRNYYDIVFKANKPCEQPEHSHNDECQATCTQEAHLHSEECGVASQTCGKEEHEHNETSIMNGGCLSCTIPEHTAHTNSCIACGQVEHIAHTPSCYTNAESSTVEATLLDRIEQTPTEGMVGSYTYWFQTYYCIYIDGTWYEYNGNRNSVGTIQQPSTQQCPSPSLHTHTDTCYSDIIHVHTDTNGCYACSKEKHTHTTACYTYNCGKQAHSHLGSCFSGCHIPEHTHTTNCSGTASKNVLTVRRKYDASLVDVWSNEDSTKLPYKGTGWWQSSRNTSQYYVFLQKIPGYNLTLTYATRSGTSKTWHYALEQLPGKTYDSTVTNNGRNYFISFSSTCQGIGNLTYDEDYFPITGFKQRDSTVPPFNNNVAYVYYLREDYQLTFHDGVNPIHDKTESILFETDISNKYFVPGIPAGKEDGSVKFSGWYTTPTCADGTEFDFTGQIMPARDLTLYAKWEPTYWDVIVYQEKPLDGDELPEVLWKQNDVPFGTLPSSIAAEPSRTPPVQEYIFAGWYYEDTDGSEKRFDFNTMPIKHDYVIYAKWTSEVPVPFTVRYVTMVDGIEVEIAEPTKGQSLAGISKSFTAKVDKELYEAYQTGYFPTSREQTQIMENKKADEGGNVITFEYVKSEMIEYRIKHVFVSEDAQFIQIVGSNTLTLTWESHVTAASSAKLKEKFNDEIQSVKVISKLTSMGISSTNAQTIWDKITNMSPDAFHQSLILVAGSTIDQNEIVFNWVGGSTITVYEVHHLYEDANGNFPFFDDNPERYNARYDENNPQPVDEPKSKTTHGYRFDHWESNNSDPNDLTLKLPDAGQDGLIIKMYYYRKDMNYLVKYVDESGLPISFNEVVTGTKKYLDELKVGDIVKDITIPGYELINGSNTVTLKNDNQVIDCIYRKQSASYYYRAISGSGRFESNDEINIPYGNQPNGNQAVADAGWILEGWYYGDRFGNNLQEVSVVGATVENGKLIPGVVSAEDVGKEFFFWAKFVPTTLTISNTVTAGTNTPDWVIPGQGFIYKIEGTGTTTTGISLTIAVPVDEELTILGLPLGDYSITLEGDWSWRYKQQEEDSAFTMEEEGTALSFTYDAPDPDVGQNGFYITDGAYNDPTPVSAP